MIAATGCSGEREILLPGAMSMLDSWGIAGIPDGALVGAVDEGSFGPDPLWHFTIRFDKRQIARFVDRNGAIVDPAVDGSWSFRTGGERSARFSCRLEHAAADRYELKCGM